MPASEEGNTFKKVDAEREGKAFRSVSGDGVLIADGAGEIVVAPGLGGAVVGSVAGPVAAVAVARSCKTEFITELVTQVCEDTVRYLTISRISTKSLLFNLLAYESRESPLSLVILSHR